MKSYKIGIILLFLLVFSIDTVCAEDVDNTTLSSTDGDVMSTGEKTYDDLSNLINSSSSSTIDIKYDYKFNTITDTQKTIIINESSLHYVIEGNDHVIDGSGSAGLFTIVNSKVTLKNIVIKNCNSTAIIALNSTLETINVTFEKNNNSNVAGAVYAKESTFISNGDKFIDNFAPDGSSIFLVDSIFDGKNNLFVNNIPANWALMYGVDSSISIENAVFANTTSRYATAIYNNYKTGQIHNCGDLCRTKR